MRPASSTERASELQLAAAQPDVDTGPETSPPAPSPDLDRGGYQHAPPPRAVGGYRPGRATALRKP